MHLVLSVLTQKKQREISCLLLFGVKGSEKGNV